MIISTRLKGLEMASDLGLSGPQGQAPEYRHTYTYNPHETDRDPSPQHTV